MNNEKLNQLYDKCSDSIDKINKSIMDNVCGPIEQIYMDLSILKDIRLGLMMKLADPVLKQYLLDGLSNYNLRATRTFLEKYPKFPYTEEKLNLMLRDEDLSDEIFCYSPDTEISYELPQILKVLISHNRISKSTKPINILINTFPLTLTSNIKLFVESMNRHLFEGRVKFNTVTCDPVYGSPTFWNHQQWMFIDDLSKLCAEGCAFSQLLFNEAFTGKTIIAPPCLTDEAKEQWKKEGGKPDDLAFLKMKMDLTANVISLLCKCIITPVTVPTPDYLKTLKVEEL